MATQPEYMSVSLPLSPSGCCLLQRVMSRPALYEKCNEITTVVNKFINKIELKWNQLE